MNDTILNELKGINVDNESAINENYEKLLELKESIANFRVNGKHSDGSKPKTVSKKKTKARAKMIKKSRKRNRG